MVIYMTAWVSATLAVVFLAVGIISLRMESKIEKRLWKIAGMALLLACALCILYLAATWLLLGGIE